MKISGREILVLGGFIAACFSAAAFGGYFTGSSVGTWYAALRKPVWNPPGWVFGPVWTALYTSMAVAAWLVWRRVGFAGGALAFGIFLLQLILNAAWSMIFFGWRNPQMAFVEICLLWLAIATTLVLFWRISAAAGWLILPYLAWVSFAAVLNFALWRLNG